MWIHFARTIGIVAAFIAAWSAFGADGPRAGKVKISQVGVFSRPTIGDVELIDSIAQAGAALTTSFKAGTDIARFVSKKCGQPSVTMQSHPEFEKLLISRNTSVGMTPDDLISLRFTATLEIPACAKFANLVGEIPVPTGGMKNLARDASIPFDYEMFAKLIKDNKLRKNLSRAVRIALSTGETGEFQKIADRICGHRWPSPNLALISAYLSCFNAATVAGANPNITDLGTIKGTIRVPIAGKTAAQVTGEDDVPLRAIENPQYEIGPMIRGGHHVAVVTVPGTLTLARAMRDPLAASTGAAAGGTTGEAFIVVRRRDFTATSTTPAGPGAAGTDPSQIALGTPAVTALESAAPVIRGLKKTRPTLNFVAELDSPERFSYCANAGDLKSGAWPFDVAEFKRAANLSNIEHSPEKGRILIADTGFDFSGDELDDQKLMLQTTDIFPRSTFHVLKKEQDPDRSADLNGDGVYGNGGWAGVNLAATTQGDVSARTNIDDPYRNHGLSVTTLALGGRGTEELRRLGKLDLEIGEVSLVPTDNVQYLDPNFVGNTIKFAQADGNNFGIINLSLSSISKSDTWDKLTNNIASKLLLVVAAGNDGQELTAEKGVWPAAFGGSAVVDSATVTEFITVGASNGNGEWVAFSNWGKAVDLLAPGCVVPSYTLKTTADGDVVGIKETTITGTSASAPLVSFVAALLAGNYEFHDKPGAIKDRIQVGTDYDAALRTRAYSSGVLNVAKVVGFKYDILDVIDKDHVASDGSRGHKLRYGVAMIKAPENKLKCGYEPPIDLASIKKIARGKVYGDPVLVLANDDATRRMKLNRYFCPPDALDDLKIDFYDTETNANESINIGDLWDYIPRS
jgi:subtilase family protein